MSSLGELWGKIAKNKLDWAYEANNEFLHSISHSETKQYLLESNDKKLAILYGKSQVGKTTLILALMGIKSDSFKKVEDILRAGREKGKSSTSIAIKYGYSNDSFWYINKDRTDEVDIANYLKNKRIELALNAKEAYDNEINIDIPAEYFDKRHSIEIVDLPGIDSADDLEQQWVPEMVGKYLVQSNLTIVVAMANDLQDVKSFNLHPSFSNWYDLPGFAVVTTHTYTQASIRDKIKHHIDSKQNLYDIFKQDSKNILDGIDKIYPLEIGDSFERFKEYEVEYNKIKPIREEILQDLRNAILDSKSEYERLTRNFKIYRTIEQNLKTNEEKLNNLTSEFEIEIEKDKRKLSELEASIDDIQKSEPKNLEDEKEKVARLTYDKFVGDITNDSLESYKVSQRSKLMKQCPGEYRWKLQELYCDVDSKDVDGILGRILRDDNKDKRTLEEAVEKVVQQLNDHINCDIEQQNIKIRKNNNKEKQNHKEACERDKKALNESISRLKGQMSELEKSHKDDKKKIEKEIELLKKDKVLDFRKFLSDKYNQKRQSIIEQIDNKENDGTAKLLYLFFLKTLENEYKKLEGQK